MPPLRPATRYGDSADSATVVLGQSSNPIRAMTQGGIVIAPRKLALLVIAGRLITP